MNKINRFTKSGLTILALLCIFTSSAHAQTPVQLAPVPAQQFLSNAGVPLASGCIYTFTTGTSTPLATFTDSTGVTQSPNPIILDAGGYASGVNGTGGLWLSNATYRFSIWSFGSGAVGSNCGNGTLQRTVDGVSSYSIINQAQNLFLSCQSSDPSGSAGELGCRSDLNKIRAFTTLWDSIVEETVPATLTNKTLTTPTITNPAVTTGSFVNPVMSGVNAQTGTSYTVASTDEQKIITFSNAGAVAVTLPQATTAGFGSGAVFRVKNLGIGTVTITPTVSTIDGAATLVLNGTSNGFQGQGADIYSDGTNYFTQRGYATFTGAIVPGHLAIFCPTCTGGSVLQDAGFAIVPPTNILISNTAPTISSGFGASATIATQNGPASFTINVGTGGTASTGTINLPTAINGWNCFANDITNPTTGGGISTKQTGSTVNTATFTGFNATPAATAWTASDILQVSCFGR